MPIPSKGIEICYASGEALRGLSDRSRATTVELWIGTTEIRPILITARRRAPARQPGTAPMSTVRDVPSTRHGQGTVEYRSVCSRAGLL